MAKTKVAKKNTNMLLSEAENVCNSRPLTYIYDKDIIDPLLPNHLIHGRTIATIFETTVNMKETCFSIESLNQTSALNMYRPMYSPTNIWKNFQNNSELFAEVYSRSSCKWQSTCIKW